MTSKFICALVFSVILTLPFGGIHADTPMIVADQVEEDWEIVVSTPDVSGVGPQITTSMSPVSDGSTPFVAFDLNYREYPIFQPGGMQLQVWSDKTLLDTASHGSNQFTTTGEAISWTQRMSIDQGGGVTYQVVNGSSTTWGNFGQGEGQIKVNFDTSTDSLIGYSPQYSVRNSGATWESNFVTRMTLVQVRYYAAGRLISTDTTPRTIIAPSGD